MKKTPPTKKPASKTQTAKPAPKPAAKGKAKTSEPKRGATLPPPSASAARGKAALVAASGAKGKGAPAPAIGYDVGPALIESFATSNRITRFLLENLHDDVWHAAPVGGRGRSVAAIACHMHNARVMWLASFGRKVKAPPKLDHLAASKADALKALDQSHEAISKMVGIALKTDGKIGNFKAGAAPFLSYLMTHDAHHRGQICLMAKQVGHPLGATIGYGMWEWSKR